MNENKLISRTKGLDKLLNHVDEKIIINSFGMACIQQKYVHYLIIMKNKNVYFLRNVNVIHVPHEKQSARIPRNFDGIVAIFNTIIFISKEMKNN